MKFFRPEKKNEMKKINNKNNNKEYINEMGNCVIYVVQG